MEAKSERRERENKMLICMGCGHVFAGELVDVCQCGHGDNVTEYVICHHCGHRQKLFVSDAAAYDAVTGNL